jgi:hypothetical protein
MTQIEIALQKATGLSYNNDDDRQDYLVQLMARAYDLSVEEFNELPKGAQHWVNDAIKARNDKISLVDFKVTNGKADDHDDAPATQEAPVQKSKVTKQKKEVKVKKEVKAPRPREVKPKVKPPKIGKVNDTFDENKPQRRVGAQSLIKRLVLKDPKISVDDLLDKVKGQGFECSRLAASTIRSGFRHSIKIIQEEGLLKNVKL